MRRAILRCDNAGMSYPPSHFRLIAVAVAAEPKMSVNFIEKGPLKTVVRVRYDFASATAQGWLCEGEFLT
jgi:hypothetical protein